MSFAWSNVASTASLMFSKALLWHCLAIFTTISALLSKSASSTVHAVASRDPDAAGEMAAVPCPAIVVRSCVLAAGNAGSSGQAAMGLAIITSELSSMAQLADAVSSTSERRARRMSLRGRIGVLLMFNRSIDKFSKDPAPQFGGFLRGSSVLRKLGDTQANPERVLMVIALSDIGKRKHAERIERCCSFAQSTAPRRRLIEDEGKSSVERANSHERWNCSFDVGRARTCRDQAKIGLGDSAQGQRVVCGRGIDDYKPHSISIKTK